MNGQSFEPQLADQLRELGWDVRTSQAFYGGSAYQYPLAQIRRTDNDWLVLTYDSGGMTSGWDRGEVLVDCLRDAADRSRYVFLQTAATTVTDPAVSDAASPGALRDRTDRHIVEHVNTKREVRVRQIDRGERIGLIVNQASYAKGATVESEAMGSGRWEGLSDDGLGL